MNLHHFPGHVRDAFIEAVESQGFFRLRSPATSVVLDGRRIRLSTLCRQLSSCGDTMPSEDCDLLDLPLGSCYADGARAVAAMIGKPMRA